MLQLAEELGYAVSESRKPGSTEWQEHISEVAASTGLSGREVSRGPRRRSAVSPCIRAGSARCCLRACHPAGALPVQKC